jgi:hypothetical protein
MYRRHLSLLQAGWLSRLMMAVSVSALILLAIAWSID